MLSAYFREQKVKWLKYIAYFRGESLSGGKHTHTYTSIAMHVTLLKFLQTYTDIHE